MTTLDITDTLADKIVALAHKRQQTVEDFLSTLLHTTAKRDNSPTEFALQQYYSLRETEMRYQRAEEIGQFGHWERDFKADTARWSLGTYRIFGLDPTQPAPNYEGLFKHIHPEDRTLVHELMQNSAATGAPFDVDYRVIRPDGEIRTTHSSARFDLNSAHKRLIGTLVDITERKQIEDETRIYKAAVEASNDLIIVVDKHYRYVIANETYLKYHHVERQHIIGQPISAVVGQTLFDAELRYRYDLCFQGETQHFENTYTYPILGTRHTFASWLPVRDDRQQVIGAVVIIHDITGRKQTELALRANEQKLQTLFDVLPVGISLLNHNREIVQANPMLEKILDKPMAALLSGDSINRRYIHNNGSPIQPDEFPWEVAIQKQQPVFDAEVGVVKENGDTIWTSVNAAPLAVDDLSAVVVTRDITRRKEAEILTRQLHNEREQVKILRDFITNVSHDLNTPITQIITTLYLLKRSATENQQPRLSKLEAHTTQLRDIVQDLIQMSELDAKADFAYFPTDVKNLLETLLLEFGAAAHDKNQQVSFDCQLDKFVLNADGGYLRLALQNILDNALEYTPEGGSIMLTTYHHGTEYVIEIADSGIGIDEQHLAHIFERFYRVDKSRPVGEGHTGMGLAIAQKIIQLHHGWIEVESEPNHGSIFRIFLPDSSL